MSSRIPLPLLPSSIRWTFVLLVVIVIVYYSVLAVAPEHPSPESTSVSEFRHFLAYLAFGVSLAYATVTRPESWAIRALFVIVTVAICGALIEIAQAFNPERTFALSDIAVNTTAGITSTLWFAYERYSRPIDVEKKLRTWLDQNVE